MSQDCRNPPYDRLVLQQEIQQQHHYEVHKEISMRVGIFVLELIPNVAKVGKIENITSRPLALNNLDMT